MQAASRRGELPPFNFAFSFSRFRNRSIPNMCPVAGNPLREDELTRLTARVANRRMPIGIGCGRAAGVGARRREQTGFSLGIRESRRIRGLKTLDREMVLGALEQPDAIGHGFWMIDIHDPKGSGYTTWNDPTTRTWCRAARATTFRWECA